MAIGSPTLSAFIASFNDTGRKARRRCLSLTRHMVILLLNFQLDFFPWLVFSDIDLDMDPAFDLLDVLAAISTSRPFSRSLQSHLSLCNLRGNEHSTRRFLCFLFFSHHAILMLKLYLLSL